MHLVTFFKSLQRRDLVYMALLTVVAGLANALLVIAVNVVATEIAKAHWPGLLASALFVGAFLVYYFSQHRALTRAVDVIESYLRRRRLDVVQTLRHSELVAVNQVGAQNLARVVANETNHLSVAFPLLLDSVQQSVLLVFSLAYLTYLSPLSASIFIGLMMLGGVGFIFLNRSYGYLLRQADLAKASMIQSIGDIVLGAKLLRLHEQKSQAVLDEYRIYSHQYGDFLVNAGQRLAWIILLMSGATYIVLGVVVLWSPDYFDSQRAVIFQIVPTLLFCIGALDRIVVQLSMFTRAEMGLAAIDNIEQSLAAAHRPGSDRADRAGWVLQQFHEIDYDNIVFRYPGDTNDHVFQSGPWSLKINRGEVIFLKGGNGSGKSTALRLMCGLYTPVSGVIRVDGKILDNFGAAGFREQFGVIFNNFHLFDRLYGIEAVSPDRVNALIIKMGLGGKVSFKDGQFTTLALSTGQRKRLALIVALLEDRPILVFDEWAAEQDVAFRDYFYAKLIPELKQQGKTILAASHDERYWGVADRVLAFDLGVFESVDKPS